VAPFSNYLDLTQYQTQLQSKTSGEWYDVCDAEWFECRISMQELRSQGYAL